MWVAALFIGLTFIPVQSLGKGDLVGDPSLPPGEHFGLGEFYNLGSYGVSCFCHCVALELLELPALHCLLVCVPGVCCVGVRCVGVLEWWSDWSW